MTVWNVLEDLRRRENRRRGYEVKTPLIYDIATWKTSGHWEKFRADMYLVAGEGEEPTSSLKPMNCPGHMLLFGTSSAAIAICRSATPRPRRCTGTSWRAPCTGSCACATSRRTTRTSSAPGSRSRTEIFGCLDFASYLYDLFDMGARVELSTRPDNKLGTDEEWDFTEGALAAALERRGIDYHVSAGDGAFYGPKIDLHMTDVLGRSWQMGTIQLDAQMPAAFGLTYMGQDNAEHTPYVVHRALLGSLERFMGILIEHYGGAFPLWLAPVQVRADPGRRGAPRRGGG